MKNCLTPMSLILQGTFHNDEMLSVFQCTFFKKNCRIIQPNPRYDELKNFFNASSNAIVAKVIKGHIHF